MGPALYGGTGRSCLHSSLGFPQCCGEITSCDLQAQPLPGAAQGLSEGTTLGCWSVKLKNFPAAAVVLLEEVFQVKSLVKLQEETGFVQVMVLAVREGSRGPVSPGLSPPGCCGSLHHPGEWKAAYPVPLNKHTQLWKAFLSFWCRTGGAFTVFQKCFPAWKQVFLPIFSGFLCFSAVSICFVWSETNKNPQEALPRRRVQCLPVCHTQQQCDAQLVLPAGMCWVGPLLSLLSRFLQ